MYCVLFLYCVYGIWCIGTLSCNPVRSVTSPVCVVDGRPHRYNNNTHECKNNTIIERKPHTQPSKSPTPQPSTVEVSHDTHGTITSTGNNGCGNDSLHPNFKQCCDNMGNKCCETGLNPLDLTSVRCKLTVLSDRLWTTILEYVIGLQGKDKLSKRNNELYDEKRKVDSTKSFISEDETQKRMDALHAASNVKRKCHLKSKYLKKIVFKYI